MSDVMQVCDSCGDEFDGTHRVVDTPDGPIVMGPCCVQEYLEAD